MTAVEEAAQWTRTGRELLPAAGSLNAAAARVERGRLNCGGARHAIGGSFVGSLPQMHLRCVAGSGESERVDERGRGEAAGKEGKKREGAGGRSG